MQLCRTDQQQQQRRKGKASKPLKPKGVINLKTDIDQERVPNSFNQSIVKWQCVICTFENTKSQIVCDMCMNLRVDVNATPPEQPVRLTQEELTNKHWNYIVRYCKLKKQSYMDDSFPPNPTSLYYCPAENKDAVFVKWRRLKDVVVDDGTDVEGLSWTVFRQPRPSDILQGN